MVTISTDAQVVGETSSTLWSVIQQGPVSLLLHIKNSGVNTMNYRIQEYNGTAWADLGASGTDYYTTLAANEVKSFKVSSNYPQVQMVGNASGGAYLEITISRVTNRSSGGSFPLINL